MLGFRDISVEFLTGHPVLVVLGLVGLLVLTWLLYYRTNPPLPAYRRVILGILRVLAVVALALALLEPVITYNREFERKRRVDLLLDRSASMDRTESGLTRVARSDSLLSGATFGQLKGSVDLTTWYFGGNLASETKNLDREQTALGDAVAGLAAQQMAEPPDQILLLTDGRSNSGRSVQDAAAGFKVPILVVNMAGESDEFDIALQDVQFNPVLFVGQATEIKVQFSWQHAAGKAFKAQLRKGERLLAEASFAGGEESGRGDVTISWTPDNPGQELLSVTIPPLVGEQNAANNSRTIAVKILKSRLLVLLATDHPDYEIGFMKRYLEQSDRFEVDLKVTGPRAGNLAGKFPSAQTELNRYDLVVLYDPDPAQYEARQQLIKSYLSERGGAVWVLLGERFAVRGPVGWFNQLLPFSQSIQRKVDYFEFHGEPSEASLFHPSVRLADDRGSIRETWAKLPPFRALVRCDQVDPQSVVLAYAAEPIRAGFRSPILGFKRFGPGKLMASAALPFWSWGFADIGAGGSGAAYGTFLDGSTRWLTVRDDFDPIRISPEKEVFSRGEPVRFLGFAFDQGYRPITGVVGNVRLTGASAAQPLDRDVIEVGEGRYEGTFAQVPPGTYSYVASLSKDGQELKRTEGTLKVEPFSLEEFDQSGDPATLQGLATLTGGAYYGFRQFDGALAQIDTRPVKEQIQGEVVLWNRLWLLLLFIAALACEWVIRKANQLI
jgi:hypothetical protein